MLGVRCNLRDVDGAGFQPSFQGNRPAFALPIPSYRTPGVSLSSVHERCSTERRGLAQGAEYRDPMAEGAGPILLWFCRRDKRYNDTHRNRSGKIARLNRDRSVRWRCVGLLVTGPIVCLYRGFRGCSWAVLDPRRLPGCRAGGSENGHPAGHCDRQHGFSFEVRLQVLVNRLEIPSKFHSLRCRK